jgi:tetratricopeptide (TPR) repeat protein
VPGYEVVRELGRGGMGLVFLARQTALNRLVALKVIRPGRGLEAEEVARFRNEAEVIARLRHPNVIRIYDVGACDGLPYCALEYVEGGSLAQRLDGTPVPARQAAALVEALARAVHSAHECGIVHRDLKPANVLLQRRTTTDSTDSTDKKKRESASSVSSVLSVVEFLPKITDFGLAKDLSEEAGSGHTRTGTILGTPSYMAPEQAEGKSKEVGPAVDVYALGAILYDMLTGRPPFRGETLLDTLQLVRCAEPVPPARLHPKVPRDAETVCLKCLEKDPRKRYASALALADDLRRLLAGEPIRARPVSPPERALKWARRKPAAAALAAVSALALLGAVAGSIAFAARERQRADREAGLKEEADGQRQRAERNFQKARQAVDEMLTRVGAERLANEPRLETVRRDLLGRALAFYEDFLCQRGDDPGLRGEAGRAYQRVGDIQEMLGQHRPAEQAYREALDLFTDLAGQFPGRPEYQRDLGGAHNSLAVVLQAAGRPDEAAAEFRRALAVQEGLAGDYPEVPEYRRDLAGLLHNRANLLQAQGRAAEAEQTRREAIARLDALAGRFPEQPDYRHELGRAYGSLGVLLLDGRPGEAEAALRKALALQEPLAQSYPQVPDYRHELARSHFLLGNWLLLRRQLPDGDREYARAEEQFGRLAKDFPGVPDYRQGQAECCQNHGELQRLAKRFDEGERLLGQAVDLFGELARDFPTVPAYRQGLARSYHNLGVLHKDHARNAAADEAHRQALAQRRRLVDDFPREPAYRQELAYSHAELAIVLAQGGQTREAEENFRQALALLGQAAALDPGEPAYRRDQVTQHNNLAVLLAALDRRAEAEDNRRRAVALQRRLAEDFPKRPEYRSEAARNAPESK